MVPSLAPVVGISTTRAVIFIFLSQDETAIGRDIMYFGFKTQEIVPDVGVIVYISILECKGESIGYGVS